MKYFLPVFGTRPHIFALVLMFIWAAILLPESFPVLLLSVTALGLSFLGSSDSKGFGSPVGLAIVLPIVAAVSQIAGFADWHGFIVARSIAAIVLLISVVSISIQRKRIASQFREFLLESQIQNIVPNIVFAIFISTFWLYSYKAWQIRGFNSPLSHYVHMAQMLLKTGTWRFPALGLEDPANDNFWYPNLLAHVLGVFGSFRDIRSLRIDQAFFGTWFVHFGAVATLAFLSRISRGAERFGVAIWVALFVSYSFFNHAGPELANDSPMYVFVTAVLFLLWDYAKSNNPNHLVLAGAISISATMYRVPTSVILTTTVFFVALFSSRSFFLGGPKQTKLGSIPRLQFGVLAISLILLLCPVRWYAEILKRHSNPIFPHRPASLTYLGIPGIPIRTFDELRKQRENESASDVLPEHQPTNVLLYHFLAVPSPGNSRTMLKVARGVFHGLTFSSLLTVMMLFSVVLAYVRWKELAIVRPAIQVMVAMIFSVALVNTVFGLYFKLLFNLFMPIVVLPLAVFSGLFDRTRRFHSAAIPGALSVFFLAGFELSFLRAGMGGETTAWAPLKCLISSDRPCPDVKDYMWWKVANAVNPLMSSRNKKVLIVHTEPGHYLNTIYPIRWHHEEVSFQNQGTGDLHCARTETDVFMALKSRNIVAISSVFTPFLNRYIALSTSDCPETLSKMLLNRSPSFEWMSDQVALVPESKR